MTAQATTEAARRERLFELVGRLEAVEGFAGVVASLRSGHGATLDGTWGSSRALAAAALARHRVGPLVVVCPRTSDVDTFVDDFSLFSPERVAPLDAWEARPGEPTSLDVVFGERLRLLRSLVEGRAPGVIVTSIQALMQPVHDRELVGRQTRRIKLADELAVEPFLQWLVENRFTATTAVELPGEFSLRGGILDLFAFDWDAPVRIELFGDQIESLRRFEVVSQRSLEAIEHIDVTAIDPATPASEHFISYVPRETWFLLIEPSELDDAGRHFLHRQDQPEQFHTTADTIKRIYQFASVTAESIAATSLEATCHLRIESVEHFSGEIIQVRDELSAVAHDHEVFLVCQTPAEVKRCEEIFGETPLGTSGRLHLPVGHLAEGFRLVPARTLVLSSNELFHRTETVRTPRHHLSRAIDNFLDLREGDLVVHVAHGIARYLGLKLFEKEGQVEEHLELEFHGGTKVFVPVTRIELVQKYVGGTKARPVLARIGGQAWTRHKKLAQDAVTDLAVEMLNLQAQRGSRPASAFRKIPNGRTSLTRHFLFRKRPISWMPSPRSNAKCTCPDRWTGCICGDVGYGKTEVAMRAAFKAIDSGYQVAVLVPTTVLAEQHRRTFTSRMAQYPFHIASLSRFLTAKQQNDVLAGINSGTVDIVIGTHRLIQPDVQFQNLGLVIIDEEQRFGVDAKERLKTLRQIVDVLTLTATPIPRTLHMSLLGLRDISNLVTPPEDRLAVETRVGRFDEELIRQAVIRELNRDGQIFFVHNRIYDIEALATRLRRIVPEARIEIGHGQMAEGELERVMLDFVNHKFDLLLATTIVESGLDIPNANTIFIDQADRYGLADLHQLRGRVGRYKHRAHCYLLVDPHQTLNPTAAKRLRAIEEFSNIGAGFAIAMRDLEIRGAGNLLGTQQSGHIAAVGYELYCELLEQAVRKLKHLPPREIVDVNLALPGEAFLPRSYVPDLRAKIDVYRRLSRVASRTELADVAAELVDRFGPRPPAVEQLLARMELRLFAHHWGIESIHLEDNYLVFGYTDRQRIEALAARPPKRLRVVDGVSAYLPIGKSFSSASELQVLAKSLLQPD